MRRPRAMVGPLMAVLLLLPLLASAAGPPSPRAKSKAAGRAAAPQVLPWVEDDLTRAVAEAKARKLPIFVESWAPW